MTAWRDRGGEGLPPGFVDTTGVSSPEQLAMQVALQQYVDSAISKTVTVPSATAFEEFSGLRLISRAPNCISRGCAC